MEWSSLPRDALKERIYAIMSYQYSPEFAEIFLSPFDQMKFKFSRNTSKLKQISVNNILEANYRPTFGNFTLTMDSAYRIYPKLKSRKFNVVIQSEVAEFIKDGKSVFAKHVIAFDPQIHVGDEVFVVDEEDNLLGIGKLEMPPIYLTQFQSGSAVRVRKGLKSLKISI